MRDRRPRSEQPVGLIPSRVDLQGTPGGDQEGLKSYKR